MSNQKALSRDFGGTLAGLWQARWISSGHHMVIGALVKGSPISKGPRRRYDLQMLAFVCIGPFHIPCNVVVVPVYRPRMQYMQLICTSIDTLMQCRTSGRLDF